MDAARLEENRVESQGSRWRAGAIMPNAAPAMSSVVREESATGTNIMPKSPYPHFIAALFIENTIGAETTVQDRSLTTPWMIRHRLGLQSTLPPRQSIF